MCRMCLVEVSGPRGASLQPACFVEVADGQEVFTASDGREEGPGGRDRVPARQPPARLPRLRQGRRVPPPGPVASRTARARAASSRRNGTGPSPSRSAPSCSSTGSGASSAPAAPVSPRRSPASRSSTSPSGATASRSPIFPGDPFTSYFAGNTVQICPVGALTSTPYRFKSRPWDLEQVETTCTTCAVGCRMVAQSSAGELVRYLGVDSEPVNQSWLCDRGRYGFEAVEAPERLGAAARAPRRTSLEPATWHEALAPGRDGVAPGARGTGPGRGRRHRRRPARRTRTPTPGSKLAKGVIGTDNFDAQLGDGLPAELVASLPRATIDDAMAARGRRRPRRRPPRGAARAVPRLRDAAANDGLRIIDCSPVPTALSPVATSVPYRPGEAAELAPCARRRRARPSVGDLDGRARDGEPGAGIVVVLGRPVARRVRQTQVAAAAAVFAGGLAGCPFPPGAAARQRPRRHRPRRCPRPSARAGRRSTRARAWFEAQWGSVPAARGLDTAGMLEAAAAGELEHARAPRRRPAVRLPGPRPCDPGARAGQLPRGRRHDRDASSMLADVVLPAAGFAERDGTTTNIEGRVSRLGREGRAAGCRPGGLGDRNRARGATRGRTSVSSRLDGIWAEIERSAPAHCRLHGRRPRRALPQPTASSSRCRRRRWSSRSGRGSWTRSRPRVSTRSRSRVRRSTPERRCPGVSSRPVEDEEGGEPADDAGDAVPAPPIAASPMPAPPSAGAARNGARPPALLRFDAAGWTAKAPPPVDRYALRLVVRRGLYDHGTLVQSRRSLAPLAEPQQLRLRAQEMEKLGVDAGRRCAGAVAPRRARGRRRRRRPLSRPGWPLLQFNAAPIDEPSASVLIDSSAIGGRGATWRRSADARSALLQRRRPRRAASSSSSRSSSPSACCSSRSC